MEALGSEEAEVALRGMRYEQWEPVYGGRVDTAANLRGRCAVMLARMRYPEAHIELVRLLVDAEAPARLAAVGR